MMSGHPASGLPALRCCEGCGRPRKRDVALAVEQAHCTELTATLTQTIARADQLTRDRAGAGAVMRRSTSSAIAGAFRHQRAEAVEALAALLDAVRARATAVVHWTHHGEARWAGQQHQRRHAYA